MTTVIAHFKVIWCGVFIQHYLTVSKLARSVNLRPLGNPKRGEIQRKSVGIERKLDITSLEKCERIAVVYALLAGLFRHVCVAVIAVEKQ
jgi:hypothetical protein